MGKICIESVIDIADNAIVCYTNEAKQAITELVAKAKIEDLDFFSIPHNPYGNTNLDDDDEETLKKWFDELKKSTNKTAMKIHQVKKEMYKKIQLKIKMASYELSLDGSFDLSNTNFHNSLFGNLFCRLLQLELLI